MGRHKKVDIEVVAPVSKEIDLTPYFEFSSKWHGDQKYGNDPYVRHLHDVVNTLKDWGFADDEQTLIAGILHDVLEDTKATKQDILNLYHSSIVLNAVVLVTDPEGSNRVERKKALYDRFEGQSFTTMSVLIAARVKLADRYCNQNESLNTREYDKTEMYVKEFPEFIRVFIKFSSIEPWLKIAWTLLFDQYKEMILAIEKE